MKRLLSIFTILVSLLAPTLAAESLQLVMPKIVYTGDTVEIRYIFHSDSKIFGGEFENTQAKMNLRTDYDFFSLMENDFHVNSAALEKINGEYTLSLSVIPWKTGFLQIPPFNLTSLVRFSMTDSSLSVPTVPFVVTLSPVEVKSLVEKTGNRTFLPQASPLSLPGTTALLVVLSAIAVIFVALFLFALLRLPKIARFLENFSYLHSLKRNSRKAVRKLNALQKDSAKLPSDKDFASRIQHILRDFLTRRFGTDFSSVTTARFHQVFMEIMGDSLSEHQEDTIEELVSIFTRLDYVRFAENAGFLMEGGEKTENERFTVTSRAIHLIESFDADEEEA